MTSDYDSVIAKIRSVFTNTILSDDDLLQIYLFVVDFRMLKGDIQESPYNSFIRLLICYEEVKQA